MTTPDLSRIPPCPVDYEMDAFTQAIYNMIWVAAKQNIGLEVPAETLSASVQMKKGFYALRRIWVEYGVIPSEVAFACAAVQVGTKEDTSWAFRIRPKIARGPAGNAETGRKNAEAFLDAFRSTGIGPDATLNDTVWASGTPKPIAPSAFETQTQKSWTYEQRRQGLIDIRNGLGVQNPFPAGITEDIFLHPERYGMEKPSRERKRDQIPAAPAANTPSELDQFIAQATQKIHQEDSEDAETPQD